MSKCDLFKNISEIIWDKICRNHLRDNRLNEEGISRIIVLDEIQNYIENNMTFTVFAQKSLDEVNTGSDLELYIDNGQSQFFRVLLQAKMMERDCRFMHLNRDSGNTGRKQYDTLDEFSRKVKCDAYYLMYNGCPTYKKIDYDCAGQYDEKQFGCAIMSIQDIKYHCESYKTGTLGTANNPKPFGRPWRFLSCCNYQYVNGSKLYNLDEIDMDNHFESLFNPGGLTGFITVEQIKNRQTVEDSNEIIHKDGWNPFARIILSKSEMRIGADGFLKV